MLVAEMGARGVIMAPTMSAEARCRMLGSRDSDLLQSRRQRRPEVVWIRSRQLGLLNSWQVRMTPGMVRMFVLKVVMEVELLVCTAMNMSVLKGRLRSLPLRLVRQFWTIFAVLSL